MKLLLDQGVPRSVAKLMRRDGIDTIHAGEIGLSTDREKGIKSRHAETLEALEDIAANRVVNGERVLEWIAVWGIDSETEAR